MKFMDSVEISLLKLSVRKLPWFLPALAGVTAGADDEREKAFPCKVRG
jgi:hypothetical protein